MTHRLRAPSLALLALLAFAAVAGCDRNQAGTALAPTGIRPAPAVWPGSVTGSVLFDPLNTPDLGAPPFPPTRVELFRGADRVAVDSLTPTDRNFTFTNVMPGDYSVVARSTAFHANSIGGIRVRDEQVDAGNVTLQIDPAAITPGGGMELIGTMPGYRIADLDEGMFPIDVTGLYSPTLGVWTYPSQDYPDGIVIAAGTYHFKFATAFPASVGNITGWGDPGGVTLTPPVVNHPSVLAGGSATDIVMNFPASGVYTFTLDERRQTFSVTYLHASPTGPARLARR